MAHAFQKAALQCTGSRGQWEREELVTLQDGTPRTKSVRDLRLTNLQGEKDPIRGEKGVQRRLSGALMEEMHGDSTASSWLRSWTLTGNRRGLCILTSPGLSPSPG